MNIDFKDFAFYFDVKSNSVTAVKICGQTILETDKLYEKSTGLRALQSVYTKSWGQVGKLFCPVEKTRNESYHDKNGEFVHLHIPYINYEEDVAGDYVFVFNLYIEKSTIKII